MRAKVTTAVCALVIAASALMAAFMLPAGQAVLTSEPVTATRSSSSAVLYIMRSYQGKVAVFEPGKSEPSRVLDVYVETLPKDEQDKLAAGIDIESQAQLESMIDNYTS